MAGKSLGFLKIADLWNNVMPGGGGTGPFLHRRRVGLLRFMAEKILFPFFLSEVLRKSREAALCMWAAVCQPCMHDSARVRTRNYCVG